LIHELSHELIFSSWKVAYCKLKKKELKSNNGPNEQEYHPNQDQDHATKFICCA
jgi:hypothetical protein